MMTTAEYNLEERYGELSDTYEAMVAGDHNDCYEGETPCPELDSVLEMMQDVVEEMKKRPNACHWCGLLFDKAESLRYHLLDRGAHDSPVEVVLYR